MEPWPDSAASPLAAPLPFTERVVPLPFTDPLLLIDPASLCPLRAPLAEPEPLPANCRFGALAEVVPVPLAVVFALRVVLPALPLLDPSRVLT